MIIRPSAAIRQNYNEIAEICKKTSELFTLLKMGKEILLLWILLLSTEEKKC